MSKLHGLINAFLEVGWLAVAVVAVLFFDPFSLQEFDPSRVFLFRSLALLLLAALVIRELETHKDLTELLKELFQGFGRTPFIGLVLAFALIYLLATFLSVSPRISFWGSHERAQGTYTLFSYMALFLILLRALRRPDQVERLITVLLAVSFPVAMYGVLQHFGVTLLQFTGRYVVVTDRVVSTVGNAIFVAAYLAMVVPLTLWRLVTWIQNWRTSRSVGPAVGAGVYAILLGLQLLCMLYTQSRGPLLAVTVALFFMSFLATLLYGRRRWTWTVLAAGVLFLLFLVALNLPALPLDAVRELPYLRRFSLLSASISSGTFGQRIATWETTLRAVAASPFRLLLGYGPETMGFILDRFWSRESVSLFGERIVDRAHNAVLDHLFETGIVGTIIYLLLYGLIFYRVYRWLGLVITSQDRRAFAGFALGGAGVGLLVAWIVRGDWVFAGIGVPGGMLAGLFLYLVIRFVRAEPLQPRLNLPEGILLIALSSAVVGHLVEGFTGIGILATRSYFWVYLAVLILLGQRQLVVESMVPESGMSKTDGGRRRQRTPAAPTEPSENETAGLGSLVAESLIVSGMLACLVVAFLHGFNLSGARGAAVGLIVLSGVFNGLLLLVERQHPDRSGLGQQAVIYFLTVLIWVMPFTAYYFGRVQTHVVFDERLLVFVLWLCLTIVAAAVTLAWGRLTLSHRPFARGARAMVYPVILVLTLFLVWTSNVNPMRADVYAKVSESATAAGRRELALDSLYRAVQLNPDQAEYYLLLGDAYLDQATLISDSAAQNTWFQRARQAFVHGWRLAPDDSDYPRKLGVLYQRWAEESFQVDYLRESLSYFLAAAERNPNNPRVRMGLADVYFALGQEDKALTEYQYVVSLGDRDHLAEAYAAMGDVYVSQGELSEAAEVYGRAMQVGYRSQHVLAVRRSMAENNPNRVEFRERLGLLYAGMGRREEAIRELRAASQLAGTEERAQIQQIIQDLEVR